jgi:uncharacterized protein YndB with AHSA1/START domain
MTSSIQHEFFFPHQPQVVWEYLTKAELIEQWLMKNDFLPIVGYDFTFHTRPMPNLHFDGIVYCKVLEMVPCKKLSYSWKGGPGNRQITLDSLVVWELHPKDNGTKLSLLHTGFRELEDFTMYSIMNDGWLKNIHKIASLINTAAHGTTNA